MAPKLTGATLCVVCYCEQPELDHIDFDAEIDRGFYAEHTDNPVPLDQCIICEKCYKAAGHLVDMEDSIEQAGLIKSLRSRVDSLERRVKEAEGYASRLEEAFEHRPERITAPRRGQREWTPEQRKAASERMKQIRAEGTAPKKEEKEVEPVG